MAYNPCLLPRKQVAAKSVLALWQVVLPENMNPVTNKQLEAELKLTCKVLCCSGVVWSYLGCHTSWMVSNN